MRMHAHLSQLADYLNAVPAGGAPSAGPAVTHSPGSPSQTRAAIFCLDNRDDFAEYPWQKATKTEQLRA